MTDMCKECNKSLILTKTHNISGIISRFVDKNEKYHIHNTSLSMKELFCEDCNYFIKIIEGYRCPACTDLQNQKTQTSSSITDQ